VEQPLHEDYSSPEALRVSGDLLTETRDNYMARHHVAGVSKIIASITKKSEFKFRVNWEAHLDA
jgi:hypothetical protein